VSAAHAASHSYQRNRLRFLCLRHDEKGSRESGTLET
jgi:hypothetical protein